MATGGYTQPANTRGRWGESGTSQDVDLSGYEYEPPESSANEDLKGDLPHDPSGSKSDAQLRWERRKGSQEAQAAKASGKAAWAEKFGAVAERAKALNEKIERYEKRMQRRIGFKEEGRPGTVLTRNTEMGNVAIRRRSLLGGG